MSQSIAIPIYADPTSQFPAWHGIHAETLAGTIRDARKGTFADVLSFGTNYATGNNEVVAGVTVGPADTVAFMPVIGPTMRFLRSKFADFDATQLSESAATETPVLGGQVVIPFPSNVLDGSSFHNATIRVSADWIDFTDYTSPGVSSFHDGKLFWDDGFLPGGVTSSTTGVSGTITTLDTDFTIKIGPVTGGGTWVFRGVLFEFPGAPYVPLATPIPGPFGDPNTMKGGDPHGSLSFE